MNPKISVLIPVYGVEKYLKKCLDSVVNQTLQEIEIILVDDCSEDNSIDIIKEFQLKDQRIKYLKNKKNSGAGFSRNRGLEIAKGEYIYFLDSDDYIEKDSLRILYTKAHANNLDILEGRFFKVTNGKKIKSPADFTINNQTISGQEYVDSLKSISIVVWSKLWKRSFIIKNDLKFTHKKYEDVLFVLTSMTKATRVTNIDYTFYNYIVRENSIMTSAISETNLEDALTLIQGLEKLYISTKGQLINHHIHKFFIFGLTSIYTTIIKKSEYKILRKKYADSIMIIFRKYRFEIFRNKRLGLLQKIMLSFSPKLLSFFYAIYNKLKSSYN